MKQIVYLVSFLLLFSALPSCGSYYCATADGLKISTINIDKKDMDTIILRKFVKGSNYSKLIDTFLIDNAEVQFATSHDTASMVSYSSKSLLQSQYDYEILITGINKLVKISNIYEPQQKMKRDLTCNKPSCMNMIRSYQKDGKSVSIEYNNYRQLYIQH